MDPPEGTDVETGSTGADGIGGGTGIFGIAGTEGGTEGTITGVGFISVFCWGGTI